MLNGNISNERRDILEKISHSNYIEYMEQFINKEAEVLFENIDKEGYLIGYTKNYLKVKVKGEKDNLWQIKKVLLTKIDLKEKYILATF